MTEVEKMRSSQLADMAAPELQVRFEHAKKLLAMLQRTKRQGREHSHAERLSRWSG